MVTPTIFLWDKKTLADKKVAEKYVLIPWYPISYLTIAGYDFFGGGAYGSLPDAAIWWCLRTGGGGVLTREHRDMLSLERYGDQQLRRRACPEFVADRAMILMLLEVILFL